jgi:hypothetical protein
MSCDLPKVEEFCGKTSFLEVLSAPKFESKGILYSVTAFRGFPKEGEAALGFRGTNNEHYIASGLMSGGEKRILNASNQSNKNCNVHKLAPHQKNENSSFCNTKLQHFGKICSSFDIMSFEYIFIMATSGTRGKRERGEEGRRRHWEII